MLSLYQIPRAFLCRRVRNALAQQGALRVPFFHTQNEWTFSNWNFGFNSSCNNALKEEKRVVTTGSHSIDALHFFPPVFVAFVCVWTVSSFFSIQEEEASHSVDIGERAIFRLSLFLASSFSEKKNPRQKRSFLRGSKCSNRRRLACTGS